MHHFFLRDKNASHNQQSWLHEQTGPFRGVNSILAIICTCSIPPLHPHPPPLTVEFFGTDGSSNRATFAGDHEAGSYGTTERNFWSWRAPKIGGGGDEAWNPPGNTPTGSAVHRFKGAPLTNTVLAAVHSNDDTNLHTTPPAAVEEGIICLPIPCLSSSFACVPET